MVRKKPINHQTANPDAGSEDAREQQSVEAGQAVYQGWHADEREHHRIERLYWRLSAILTAVAVAFTFVTLVLGYRTYLEAIKATTEAHSQALEAKRQADIAQAALNGSDRPWITLSGLKMVSTTDFNDATTINLQATYINTGRSVATNVVIVTEAMMMYD